MVEVRSTSDSLKKLRAKMTDIWMANGVPLAWLIDLKNQRITVYRPEQAPVTYDGFERTLDGAPVLHDFSFDFRLLMR